MAEKQAAAPVVDKAQTEGQTEQESSILTGKTQAADGTTPLAEGAASELPRKWMNSLDGDQKADAQALKSLEKFERGLPDISKAYVELERKLGSAITIPGEKATDEERVRFRKAMGVPDKPTDYKIERAKLPAGMFEKLHDSMLELAHTTGMTPSQTKAMHALVHREIVQTISAGLKVVKSTMQETETALRTEAGAGYEVMAVNWDRGLRSYFNDRAIQLFSRSGLGNDPDILRGFAKIGATVQEHKVVDGKPAGVGEVKPLEELMYGKQPEKKVAGA